MVTDPVTDLVATAAVNGVVTFLIIGILRFIIGTGVGFSVAVLVTIVGVAEVAKGEIGMTGVVAIGCVTFLVAATAAVVVAGVANGETGMIGALVTGLIVAVLVGIADVAKGETGIIGALVTGFVTLVAVTENDVIGDSGTGTYRAVIGLIGGGEIDLAGCIVRNGSAIAVFLVMNK